jgi:lipid II:glycine glycyltransferase (peptidoglycan interpeptide bridge formation enzyme)
VPKLRQWYNARVTSGFSPSDWEALLADHPEAHILQTAAWGGLKSRFGWVVDRLHCNGCGAQVLFRGFPLGFSLAYIPMGPFGDWLPQLLPELDELCRQHRAIALKIEPDLVWDPEKANLLQGHGFLRSTHTVQPSHTLVVDLEGGEDHILARMRQKTRYNIRLAGRKGVTVRPWEDASAFAQMVQQTAKRDDFGGHVPAYYEAAYELFHPTGACELFVAEYEAQPLAALMVFRRGRRAWYLYGASTDLHRNLMPNHLLQWEAIRWAIANGCTHYDLWGIPEADLETLEAEFAQRRNGLWGVYRFKRGFGGDLVRTMGAWDRPYKSALYHAYRWLAPRWGG